MAKTKQKQAAKTRRPKHRASWRGQLRFGLVTFPVQAFNVHLPEQGEFHFHQLHAACHRRIHYQKVCPVHGEVSADEIVSGYEYRKGQYVEIDPEELDALRSSKERALTVDAFIDADELDPVYYDGRRYYLLPDGELAKEPYAVLAEAMRRRERAAVGQVVFSGREQLVHVRSLEGVLLMSMLDYSAEVKSVDAMASELPSGRVSTQNLKLAEMLVDASTLEHFDIDRYHDRNREKVKQLIDAKVEGREVVAPEEEEEPEVINLMDALRKSLGQGKSKASGGKSRGRHGRGKSRRRA